MKVKLHNPRVTEPQAFVTKGRQRVKQYGNNTVYLQNGEEFELELFNPTSNKILAEISLNGNSIGSGIVLRPGERVFLERYLDKARKFLFETYEIDGADHNAVRAAKQNGIVEVKFFTEFQNFVWYSTNVSYYNWNQPVYGNIGTTLINDSIVKSTYTTNSVNYCCSNTGGVEISADGGRNLSKSIEETGRVEQGSHSNQRLEYDNTSFNTWASWTTKWTILPESKRPYVREDLKVFCTNCGAKQKKSSHKFCPHCGNKF